MRLTRLLVLTASGLLAAAIFSGSATADGTDIGTTASSTKDAQGCVGGDTYVQASAHSLPSYVTTAGVITSWSTMPANVANPGLIELKIARRGTGSTYTITGSSTMQQETPGRLNTFAARIPVAAGDDLGLYVPDQAGTPTACRLPQTTDSGDDVSEQDGDFPDPPVGGSVNTPLTAFDEGLDVSARIEPDADGDGYGDLTQDACPTLANTHTDCTAPSISFVPPNKFLAKGKKAAVTIYFYASESGTTSTCSLDGAAPAPCTSPFKAKVKAGKHTLQVRATDAVGNVEAAPASVSFKVKKAKHHRHHH